MHLRESSAKSFALRFSYHATERAYKPAPPRERLDARIDGMKVTAATAEASRTIDDERTLAYDNPDERRAHVAATTSETGAHG